MPAEAGRASPTVGGPLLRSTLAVAAPGNHDVASRNFDRQPDSLAYFLYWDQPLNGPVGREGGPLVPALTGPEANRAAFLRSAGVTPALLLNATRAGRPPTVGRIAKA